MAVGRLALKSVSMFFRIIEFCCAAVIIGIFSYYLATLASNDLAINVHIKAVEGISGAAVLYTAVAILLVCCLGGIAFFSFIGMLLDFCFCGAFAYVAWVNRNATKGSCDGDFVRTPYGSGNPDLTVVVVGAKDDGIIRLPSLRNACRLQKAAFAVAIIGCVFFFISIFLEFLLIRLRKKEKAYGPSPNNGYTAGPPKRKFWQRKPKQNKHAYADENGDALPAHATPGDMRQSYATDATAVGANEPVITKYGNTTYANGAGGSPTGTANGTHVNGYQTTTTTHVPAVGHQQDGYVRNHQPYVQNPTATY
ncbi:uncharacterized protein RAG0_14726 [Rhynchosporium agropyri]|uniref:MARVEL domain-containing protein n=2 Tax=Rhynchosporium TaxID=38037 RepID=A0A1E1LI24_9HELO|nr:uncharacterized protein RAG0_14726 [Rhynchosporium agropyri]CZT13535.1 uncharacterized protein RCO7_10375 [Rhynchosporium commune]